MISRRMVRSLSLSQAENVYNVFADRADELRSDAFDAISAIKTPAGINGYTLMELVDIARDMKQMEQASERVGTVIDNWDTGGMPPRDPKGKMSKELQSEPIW